MTKVKKEVLPNGLTIITETMPSVRSIAIGIWLRLGSRHERPEENGICHFIEHMVFKGSEKRAAEEIARAADSIGGHLDAFTAKETTSFSIKVLDEHLERGFDILADLVRNPVFLPEHIRRECQVIEEEIKMVQDSPDDLVHEIFTQSYWRGHALGRPILGTRRSVKGLDRTRLLDYFRAHYTPKNMVVTAAGHLEHQRIVELVAREFGERNGDSHLSNGDRPLAHPHLIHRRKRSLKQVHLCLGTPAYPQAHPKRFPCYILNTVLGGGMSSRLFQKIREERGLAYAVFSSMSAFHDTGCLSIYAGTASENAMSALRLILDEFKSLKKEPLPDDELQRAKDYLKGSLLLSLESTPSRMSDLARQELYFGRHFSLDETAAKVDAVTAEAVMEVAQEIFQPDQLALTVLGPHDDLQITRDHLVC